MPNGLTISLSTIEVSKIFNGSGMIELAEMNWWKGSLALDISHHSDP